MILGDLDSMIRLLVFGTIAYLCAIVMLRLSGSRTLAKMHA